MILQLVLAEGLCILGIDVADASAYGTEHMTDLEVDGLVVTIQVGLASEGFHSGSEGIALASLDGAEIRDRWCL
jgi:hypothetical protein